jgi:hypothetical protein
MSKLIRQLLQEDDPLFAVSLTRLEQSAGNPGIDVKLTAEVMSLSRAKISALGLDPRDTTGAELYAALRAKAIEGNSYVLSYLGHPASVDEGNLQLLRLTREVLGKKVVWTTKPVALKKICKTNPPKKVMKAFHFTSVDSLVKRMDTAEIFLAARIVESKTWWDKTKKLFAALQERDFEQSELKIIACNDSRWIPLLNEWEKIKGHRVIGSKETASLCFSAGIGDANYLSALIAVLRTANEVCVYSSYLKLHFVHPSIGNVLVHAVEDGELIHTTLSGVVFHWRDVQRYFGTLAAEDEVSFVHLDTHDLGWMQTETMLSLKVPELAFWIGTDMVGVSYGSGRVISLNVADVSVSVNLELGYTNMMTNELGRALRSELMARYVQFPASRALVLKQFDISSISGENW